jgi:hypothetical protein
MAETRYNSEDCRIEKRLQQMTDPGRYVLNVPGNGPRPDYIEDPQIILQKWGANLYSNSIDLESELKNINRSINKDCLGKDEYQRFRVNAAPVSYPSSRTMFTEQSRAIMPPWTVFDKQQVHFAYLPLNPQENVCFSFQNNLSTRILEKDYYQEKVDCRFYNISGQQAGTNVRETNFL